MVILKEKCFIWERELCLWLLSLEIIPMHDPLVYEKKEATNVG